MCLVCGGIPFVLKLEMDTTEAPRDRVRIDGSDFDLFLEKVSDPFPTQEDD